MSKNSIDGEPGAHCCSSTDCPRHPSSLTTNLCLSHISPLMPQPLQFLLVALAGLGFATDRIRDMQQGPDGNLYIATERASTGVRSTGTVMRIEPAP
jgi:hypothetical protein